MICNVGDCQSWGGRERPAEHSGVWRRERERERASDSAFGMGRVTVRI